ncbi:MAG: hypothetical protein IJS50_05370 [Desulfovibrio sp.]|nr:hypothetical protein [Desulfovibrio sp.]
MYEFLTGPCFVLSLILFFLGLLIKAVLYIRGLDWRLERVAYGYHKNRSIPGAICSIVKWLIPAATSGWRVQPIAQFLFFLLHFGAILVPLFLLSHTVLLEHYTGIALPALPTLLADILTICSICALALIAVRRFMSPMLRQLNTWQDWFILLLTFLPFFTGFIARLDAGCYNFWITLHVLTGEIFLILAPWTKLSHIVLFFMSRAQLGMDYAIKRGGDNRGGVFPW